jgi:hypothetical protein
VRCASLAGQQWRCMQCASPVGAGRGDAVCDPCGSIHGAGDDGGAERREGGGHSGRREDARGLDEQARPEHHAREEAERIDELRRRGSIHHISGEPAGAANSEQKGRGRPRGRRIESQRCTRSGLSCVSCSRFWTCQRRIGDLGWCSEGWLMVGPGVVSFDLVVWTMSRKGIGSRRLSRSTLHDARAAAAVEEAARA